MLGGGAYGWLAYGQGFIDTGATPPPPSPEARARRGVKATMTSRHDLQAALTERQTRKATLS